MRSEPSEKRVTGANAAKRKPRSLLQLSPRNWTNWRSNCFGRRLKELNWSDIRYLRRLQASWRRCRSRSRRQYGQQVNNGKIISGTLKNITSFGGRMGCLVPVVPSRAAQTQFAFVRHFWGAEALAPVLKCMVIGEYSPDPDYGNAIHKIWAYTWPFWGNSLSTMLLALRVQELPYFSKRQYCPTT